MAGKKNSSSFLTRWIGNPECGLTENCWGHIAAVTMLSNSISRRVLRPSGPQELVVGVWDPTDTFGAVRGKKSLRPEGCSIRLALEFGKPFGSRPVPPAYLEEVSHRTELQGGKGRVHLEAGRSDATRSLCPSSNRASDGDTPVARTELSPSNSCLCKKNLVDFFQARSTWFSVETVLTVDPAKPWSPDSPKLYDLFLELHDENSQTVDRVRSYVGIREVSIGQSSQGHPVLLLNGQPMMLVGALDQGYWPDGIYTAPTDEALRFDIEVAKQLGLNGSKACQSRATAVVLLVRPFGPLVLQDFPSGGCGGSKNGSSLLPGGCCPVKQRFVRSFVSLVTILHHRVDYLNEGWGQFDTLRNVEWVKRLDPTRLVNEASGFPWHGGGDVIDSPWWNSPGWETNRDHQRRWRLGSVSYRPLLERISHGPTGTYEPETWRPVDGIRPPLPPLTEEARDWLHAGLKPALSGLLAEQRDRRAVWVFLYPAGRRGNRMQWSAFL